MNLALVGAPMSERPAPVEQPTFKISRLSKRYATRSGTTLALDGIDLDIAAGSFVSVVGTSGCVCPRPCRTSWRAAWRASPSP